MLAFLNNPDLLALLDSWKEGLSGLAESLSVATWIPFAVLLVLAVFLGQAAYKLIKLVTALSLGAVGYFVGEALFGLLVESFPKLPAWAVYVFGGVAALLFCILAFTKFSYAWYGLATLVGYVLLAALLPSGNEFLSLGGALLFAFLGVCLIRAVFILATSIAASGIAVFSLGAIFPEQSFLQLGGEDWLVYAVLGGLALLFATVQFLTNRKEKE